MTPVQSQALPLKRTWPLAIASVAGLFLFSIMGAPFLRAFASTAKTFIYWGLGLVVVTALVLFNLSVASVYVGAIWMTLGAYSGLEKRGLNWKKTALISVLLGLMFAAAQTTLLLKVNITPINSALNESTVDTSKPDLISSVVQPLQESLNRTLPKEYAGQFNVLHYLPGLFASSLLVALAVSLVFESKVFQLFRIRRERIASSLKWVEYRLPDAFIWFSLFSLFFSVVSFGNETIKTIAINASIFCVVAYFFQGISVVEFFARVYRWGPFTKFSIYFLVLFWMGPFVSLLGFADYWLDFRKSVRKKLK